ncbi:hypothetical protein PAPHI01_2787 [Pancytospora philotis]|nr:hypothetical protein PAPHI01_2787 [Pancytospora philotis]
MSNEEKKLTFKDLWLELDLMKLQTGLSPEEKFSKLLDKSSREVKEFIVKEQADSIAALSKSLDRLKLQSADADKIAEACAKRRLPNTSEVTFYEEVSSDLLKLGVSEKAIIKVLSQTTWPGIAETAYKELIAAESLKQWESLRDAYMKRGRKKSFKSKSAEKKKSI